MMSLRQRVQEILKDSDHRGDFIGSCIFLGLAFLPVIIAGSAYKISDRFFKQEYRLLGITDINGDGTLDSLVEKPLRSRRYDFLDDECSIIDYQRLEKNSIIGWIDGVLRRVLKYLGIFGFVYIQFMCKTLQ